MNSTEKVKKLIQLVKSGVNPAIEWVPTNGCDIEDCESYDIGMRCRVIELLPNRQTYGTETVYGFITDFSEFEEFNKSVSRTNWLDSNGEATLKWHESHFYPKDKRVNLYLQIDAANDERSDGGMFEFLQDDRTNLVNRYSEETQGSISYVTWLENQLL